MAAEAREVAVRAQDEPEPEPEPEQQAPEPEPEPDWQALEPALDEQAPEPAPGLERRNRLDFRCRAQNHRFAQATDFPYHAAIPGRCCEAVLSADVGPSVAELLRAVGDVSPPPMI